MVEPDTHNVAYWYDRWVEQRRESVEPTRLRSDEARYARYLAARLGSTPVSKVTQRKVENWIAALTEQGVGEFTIAATVQMLRQILELALEAGERKANPVDGITVGATSGIRKREESEILTEDEFERLLDAMNPHYRPLIMLAGYLGVSWSEALGLKVEDLDFHLKTVTIGRCLAVETNGHIQYREGVVRRVDMGNRLAGALAQHILATEDLRNRADQPWVFLSQKVAKHPLRPNFNKFYLRPALEDAGLDPRGITFHSLRHTAAVRMLQSGIDIREVSRILGHSTPTTTRRYYGDFIPKA